MITIKDIYQWYNRAQTDAPRYPENMTPLQALEWTEKNSKTINNLRNSIGKRPSVGELLVDAPAWIITIEKYKIKAYSFYIKIKMDEYYFTKDEYSPNSDRPTDVHELRVFYEIFYDDSLYDTIKLIYNRSMVKISGQIMEFSKEDIDYKIKLKLSSIVVIKKDLLYSNQLNDSHHFYSNHKSGCFIATAAFGNQDMTEVIQLREFRDKVLKNSVIGRCCISTYGVLSPPIALVIRQSNWLRKATRSFLRRVVLPVTKRRTNYIDK